MSPKDSEAKTPDVAEASVSTYSAQHLPTPKGPPRALQPLSSNAKSETVAGNTPLVEGSDDSKDAEEPPQGARNPGASTPDRDATNSNFWEAFKKPSVAEEPPHFARDPCAATSEGASRGSNFWEAFKKPSVAEEPPQANPAKKRSRSKAGSSDGETAQDSVESLSTDSEAESDASDYNHVAVSSTKAFVTAEDRNLELALALSKYLRSDPLLPPHPEDPSQSWTDLDNGIQLPLWHCAFSGCSFHGKTEAELKRHSIKHRVGCIEVCCG